MSMESESVPTAAIVSFIVLLNLFLRMADNQYLFEIRGTYAQNRHDTESFFRELNSAGQGDSTKSKFDVIAGYCNKDLFSGINDPTEETNTKK